MSSNGAGDAPRWRRDVVVVAVALAASIAVGLALKAVGALVPDDRIAASLQTAREDGRIGEDYPSDLRGGMIDRFTECYGFGIGLADEAGGSALREALTDPAIGSCGPLTAWLETQPPRPEPAFLYHRYWHGYTIVTRPLLATTGSVGVSAARGLGLLALLAGAAAFGWAVSRATRPAVGALAIAPLLLTTNVVIGSLNTLHGLATGWALASAAAVLELGRRRDDRALLAAAVVSGAGFAFIDLLTVPPLAWMAVGWAGLLAVRPTDATAGAALRPAARAGTTWFLGYAGMWAAKWLLTATVLGLGNVLEDVTETAGLRVGGEFEGGADRVGGAIARNLAWWVGPVPRLVALALVLVCAAVVVWRWRRTDVHRWLLLASPVAILPVWYELLRNHSQLHAWFTYRSLGLASGILLASWWMAQRPPRPEGSEGVT